MRVIEQFAETKSNGRPCEDLIVVTDDFAAIIDGASDATGAVFGGKSGGRFAADVIAETLESLAPDSTARQFANTLAAAVRDAVQHDAGALAPDVRRPVACVACVSVARRQVWSVGDCISVVNGIGSPSRKVVDDAAYRFRAAINAALLASGTPMDEVLATDPGANAARSLIDIQQNLANTVGPWGFGCINGDHVPDAYLDVYELPDRACEVILASDGFPDVRPTLAESEARLRQLLAADPAAIGELWAIGKSFRPGFNAPDDRAYLRLSLD